MSEIHFKLTAGTDVGLHRANNEDNFIVNADLTTSEWFVPQNTNNAFSLGKNGCLLVIADGMGGMNAGEVASCIAIETMQSYFSAEALQAVNLEETKSIEKQIRDAVVAADRQIKEYSKENESASGMGTTIVIAWIVNNKVYIAWCGDSRAYSFHPQTGLKQLSKDHSFVQELVDKGKLEPQYAFDHPDSNIITQSLGDPQKTARPDWIEHELSNDEIILLCSDGLSGIVRDQKIEEIISKGQEDIEKCKNALITAALEAGGYDNVTVALFKAISGARNFTPQKTSSPKKRKKANLTIVFILLLLICCSVGGWYLWQDEKAEIIAPLIPEVEETVIDTNKVTRLPLPVTLAKKTGKTQGNPIEETIGQSPTDKAEVPADTERNELTPIKTENENETLPNNE
jgi:protein phosphatase